MDGTAKIRLVALVLLTLLWGCDNLKEQPQPDSLLNAVLPDVQVPLSDSGIGNINIASANHLTGAYSIKFGTPRHGRIEVKGDTVFRYVANPDFQGRDTATYTISKTIAGLQIPPGTGKLLFFTNASACFVEAVNDYKEFSNDVSFSELTSVLKNDNVCGDTIHTELAVEPRGTIPGNAFSRYGNKLGYVPASTDWTGRDSIRYTITRNGFTSSAWFVVYRVPVGPCSQPFIVADDIFHFPNGSTSFDIPFDSLLTNDQVCPDDINWPASYVQEDSLAGTATLDRSTTPPTIKVYGVPTGTPDAGRIKYILRKKGSLLQDTAVIRLQAH